MVGKKRKGKEVKSEHRICRCSRILPLCQDRQITCSRTGHCRGVNCGSFLTHRDAINPMESAYVSPSVASSRCSLKWIAWDLNPFHGLSARLATSRCERNAFLSECRCLLCGHTASTEMLTTHFKELHAASKRRNPHQA